MTTASVFTPSHKPDHLAEVWGCLLSQTHKDWEWVVVANGDRGGEVEAFVEQLDDPRARVVSASDSRVGALKRVACENCRGDLFVEYDHDDIITENCLEELVTAYRKADCKAAFLYSNNITCDWDGTSHTFLKEFGWRHRGWEHKGRTCVENVNFPVTARSLCEILYAPDHVRAWSRVAYKLAGGHSRELRVGDDHDLMVRTYLKGVPFVHVDKVLYIHRLGPDTTSQTSLAEIERVSRATRDRHLRDLVREWCRRERLPMYDLGGAHNCPPGYLPVDTDEVVKKVPGALCCDVRRLEDWLQPDRVGCFRASDFLEHIPAPEIPGLFNKLYDLLVPGGWLLTDTPAVCDDQGRCGRGAYQDPTHLSFHSSNNFWYYSRREFAKYVKEIRCRFQTVRLMNGYPSEWHHAHLIPYVTWDACALKGDHYHPGPREI